MLDVLLSNFDLLLFLLLFTVGYTCGTIAEKRHYKSIIKREKELLKLMVVTAEGRFAEGAVRDAFLVNGSTVISNDYFKRILAHVISAITLILKESSFKSSSRNNFGAFGSQ